MAVYSALQPFIVQYGLFAVFVIIKLESAGLQLQGDNFVFLAAIAGPLAMVGLGVVAAGLFFSWRVVRRYDRQFKEDALMASSAPVTP